MPPSVWPVPVTVESLRAAAVSGRGPDELGRYYWRVTRGGARGEDVSEQVLGQQRWAAPEIVARLLRESVERGRVATRRTVAALTAKYLSHLESQTEGNPQTRGALRDNVKRVANTLELAQLGLHEVATVTLGNARDAMLRNGWASSTVRATIVALAKMWKWAIAEGVALHAWPGVEVVVYPVMAKPVPKEAEVQAIAAVLAEHDDWRVVAYHVLVETGARRSEVATLRLEDIDVGQGLVHVRGKRTSRAGPQATRTIPLAEDGAAWAALRRWCTDRLPGPLWPNPSGRALDAALRAAAARAGVRPMSPGAWRRRADIRLIDAGKRSAVKAIMDHSLKQAEAAYWHPEQDAVREAVGALRSTG